MKNNIRLVLPCILLLFSCDGKNVDLLPANSDVSADCLLSGANYVPGELVVLYPMEVVADPLFEPSNRTPVIDFITNAVNGTPTTDTYVTNTNNPPNGVLLLPPPINGGVSTAFNVYDFAITPGLECQTIDSILQSNLFSGICYLPTSNGASCYWIVNQALVPDNSLGTLDQDSDGIPDVIDNCPESRNPDQARDPGRLKGKVCDFVIG